MKTIVAAILVVLLVGAVAVPAGATETPQECAPETILVEDQVEVGTRYEHKHFLYAINKNIQWFDSERGFPWNFTGNTEAVYETREVEAPNPDYDPTCGQQPEEPEEPVNPEPQPDHLTAAWLVPMTPAEYVAAGSPTGGPADNGIWPQSLVGYEQTLGLDLAALDDVLTGCAVYQVDAYAPLDQALALVAGGTLGWTGDHHIVKAWKMVVSDDCVTPDPDPEPSPEPEGPTPDTFTAPEPEPTPGVVPEPEQPTLLPDVVISLAVRCIGADLHTVHYEDGLPVSTSVDARHPECAVEPVTPVEPEPEVEQAGAFVPAPADAGNAGLVGQGSASMFAGLAGLVAMGGVMLVARRSLRG